MGYDLDSQVLERLRRNYAEMSDGELFDLARRPDDLTEVAHEALRAEMKERGIDRALEEQTGGAPLLGSELPKVEWGERLSGGRIVLMIFHDAMEAGKACDWLEEAGIAVEIEDVSDKTAGGGSFYGGPPVAMQVIVKKSELGRAQAVLREKMKLFPLQEVEEADAVVDDGTVGVVGTFGRREDADGVAEILDDARIWHRITANPEGSVENEDAWTLEVREVDLVKAGDVVEKAMG